MKPNGKTLACVSVVLPACVGITAFALHASGASNAQDAATAEGEARAAADEAMENGGERVEGGNGTQSDEWPGQSQGMVGPNAEGSYTRDDYSSDDQMWAIFKEGVDAENAYEDVVVDDAFVKGELLITFNKGYSELECHELIWSYGGVWGTDTFKLQFDETMYPELTAYFPDCTTLEDLKKLADQLKEHPEIKYADPDYIGRVSEG